MRNIFYPQRVFAKGENYALVLLNREIKFDSNFFIKIWNNASIRHVIDGGSNHFFNLLDKLPETIKGSVKPVDIASGDFDSATKESLDRLKESSCKIVLTPDQDETDFTKGLQVLRDHLRAQTGGLFQKIKHIVCICEFTGRLDHTISNLNTLHKNAFLQDLVFESPPAEAEMDKPKVYLVSSETMSTLLPANTKSQLMFEQDVPNVTCGVVPFMGPTKYDSSGLKWNLNPDLVCSFGGLISTSNLVIQKNLSITPFDNHSVLCLELKQENYILD